MNTYKLIENEYATKGKCIYEDDYNNRLYVFKKENTSIKGLCFVAKIRFNNKFVKANPITVNVPLNDTNGANLHLDFLDGVDRTDDEDVKSGIQMTTEIIQRWIMMMMDILFLNIHPELNQQLYPGADEESIAKQKIENLLVYEELNGVVNGVMGNYGPFNIHT